MVKIQPVGQQSSQMRVRNSNPQRKLPAPPRPVHPLLRLMQKYPILVWGGLWAGMLVMTSMAVTRLTDPGYVKGVEPSPAVTAVVIESAVQVSDNEGNESLWLFGAIALGCTTGSLLILRQLKRSGSRRRRRKQLPKSPGLRQTYSQQQQPVPSKSQKGSIPKTMQRSISPKPTVPKPPVNRAVPPERRRKDNQSGIAGMDLRKRR